MTLSAILTAQNIPLIDWSRTTFNNVLLQGDTMHLKALDHGLIVLDPRIEFLSIDTYQQLSVFHVVRTCFLTRYVDL